MRDLDDLLATLAAEPVDRRLDAVEPGVWARIGDTSSPAPLRWRASAVGLALGVGVAIGSAGASAAAVGRADPIAPFTAGIAIAPSTLLAGSR